MRSVSPSRFGADGWIRTSIERFTKPVPSYSATSAKHERKDSNPVRQFWRLTALPGAHSQKGDRAESNRRQTDSQSVSGNQHRTRPQWKERESNPQGFSMALARLPPMRTQPSLHREHRFSSQKAQPASNRVPSPIGLPFRFIK